MRCHGLEIQILTTLDEIGEERHTEAIAERLGIVRHTAAKYLEILRAKGRVSCRRVGNAKLWKPLIAGLTIRPLLPEDLPSILNIQDRFQDEPGHRAFAQTMEYHIECTDAALRLGAELQGRLIGFIIGEIRVWEFGGGERTGWIKALSVSPEFQSQGVGRQLGETLLAHFHSRGVDRVRTFVDWYSGDLIAYFRTLGFEVLPMLPLEKRLNVDPKAQNTELKKT
jgi:ribosomal protein S18 acetylase RimI-like enzyme